MIALTDERKWRPNARVGCNQLGYCQSQFSGPATAQAIPVSRELTRPAEDIYFFLEKKKDVGGFRKDQNRKTTRIENQHENKDDRYSTLHICTIKPRQELLFLCYPIIKGSNVFVLCTSVHTFM